MKETVLLYGFTDQERLSRVKRALLPLGMRMRCIAPGEYLNPVGHMAGIKEIEPAKEVYEGPEFEREMMVMAGLASGRVDAVIYALRKGGVGRVDYKAVLTPVNQFWDAIKLYEEIAREHEAMNRQPGTSVVSE